MAVKVVNSGKITGKSQPAVSRTRRGSYSQSLKLQQSI